MKRCEADFPPDHKWLQLPKDTIFVYYLFNILILFCHGKGKIVWMDRGCHRVINCILPVETKCLCGYNMDVDDPDPKMDSKNTNWLKSRLHRVWNSTKFCGMCLEERDNLCSLNMEFVISKQKSSQSFIDLLNYIFNEDIENLVSSTGICEACTEQALKAYIFIHNTRQIACIMNNCVSDIYSKVVDLSEQIDDTIDCENANIMIVLESEPNLMDNIYDLPNIEIMPTNVPKIIKEHNIKVKDDIEDNKPNDLVITATKTKDLAKTTSTTNILAPLVTTTNDSATSFATTHDFTTAIAKTDVYTTTEAQSNDLITSVSETGDLATIIPIPNDLAKLAAEQNTLFRNDSGPNDLATITAKKCTLASNATKPNYLATDVTTNNFQDDNSNTSETYFVAQIKKQPKISVIPEIYLKGGNIVINPMNTDGPPSNIMMHTYKCSQCVEIFTSYRLLKEHEKAKHKKVVYRCDMCNKSYNTLQYLKIHYKTHKKSVCKVCRVVLPKTELMQHLRSKHANAMQIHPCKFCELVYYSEEALETHFRAMHLKNCSVTDETKNQCVMCLRNIPKCYEKRHRCKFQCAECPVNPCIHYHYLTSYREQILNHATEIKCIDCDYMTKRKEYLITHVNREHLNHHPFVCNDCGTQFYTKMSLRIHIEQYHNTSNICEYCDTEFKTTTRIKEHKETCKNIERMFSCTRCVAKFDTQDELTNHENLRHNGVGFSCHMCLRRFLTTVELKKHTIAIHSKVQCKKRRKNIDCTLCNIKFNSVKEMLSHEATHGPNEKFPCRVCSKEFYSLKKLYVHKQRHYERIQCSGCKKRVITAFYPQHEVRCPYKQSLALPHMCETCGKSFHLESLLRLHQKSHMESIPCPECNKLLKPSGLQKHLEKVHSEGSKLKTNTVLGGLACHFCGHTARRKWVLEAHINRYHLKVKPFVCSICKKEFCGKARLKEHLSTHTDNHTCFCSVCGKKFANRVCLKLHFRMHTGEMPYTCDICGEKFRTSSIMKTHRIKKHLDKTVACPMCESMFYMVRDMRHHFKKAHWKHKDKPFDVREVLPEEYYHLFEDGRLAKLTDEVIETEIVKSEIHILEEEQ